MLQLIKLFFMFPDSLTDTHLRKLSDRITNEEDLQDLILNVLKLPEYKIDSSLDSKKGIQYAAYAALKTWKMEQPTPEGAYISLSTALQNHGWKNLDVECFWSRKPSLKQSTAAQSGAEANSTANFNLPGLEHCSANSKEILPLNNRTLINMTQKVNVFV